MAARASVGQAGQRADMAALADALGALHNIPVSLREADPDAAVPAGSRVLESFLAPPQIAALLPTGARAAAGVVYGRARTPGISLRQRTLRIAAATGLAVGAAGLLSRRRVFADVALDAAAVPPLDDMVGALVGAPVQVALFEPRRYRANRKAQLVAVDARGRTVAYGKLAQNSLTRQLVVHEAEVLRGLESANFSGLAVPRVLALQDLGEAHLLLVSPLHPVWHGQAIAPDRLATAMVELARSGDAVTETLGESSWLAGLTARVDALGDADVRATLHDAFACLRDGHGDAACALGRSHGDWTKWNTGRTRDGQVLVWDFERAAEHTPIGHDLVHHHMSHVIESGADPAERHAAEHTVLERLGAFAPAQPLAAGLVIATWLLALAVRAGEDADAVPTEWSKARATRLARGAARQLES